MPRFEPHPQRRTAVVAGEIAIFLTHYAGWPSGARPCLRVEKLVHAAEAE